MVFSRLSSSFVRGFRTTFKTFGNRSIVQQVKFTVKSIRRDRNHTLALCH